jgi:hypothetical protein
VLCHGIALRHHPLSTSEPPLPAVVDPIDEGSFGSKYRLDDWSQRDGINVIDVYLDFD